MSNQTHSSAIATSFIFIFSIKKENATNIHKEVVQRIKFRGIGTVLFFAVPVYTHTNQQAAAALVQLEALRPVPQQMNLTIPLVRGLVLEHSHIVAMADIPDIEMDRNNRWWFRRLELLTALQWAEIKTNERAFYLCTLCRVHKIILPSKLLKLSLSAKQQASCCFRSRT